MTEQSHSAWSRFVTDYGMVFVLLLLCGYYSIATLAEQHPTGADGGDAVARQIIATHGGGASVLIAARDTKDDELFIDAIRARIEGAGGTIAETVKGQPSDARKALDRIAAAGMKLDVIATNEATSRWTVFDNLAAKYPALGKVTVATPQSYRWPNFLKTDNLLNVANQIVVIAVIAIGMTMVIITSGIDLSVGSLIALSAVVAAILIRDAAGGAEAGAGAMVLSCAAAIAVCAMIGALSGVTVTVFEVPPFIATLAMMLIASGLAWRLSAGESINAVPETFIWLGRGDTAGVPNGVIMMVALYAIAHVVMTRTTLGRYIYAVGGNAEAARLSGVPVRRVLLFVYTMCGALAGLGGIVLASQFKSGDPKFGLMYELDVIAAVVVGGTSLMGGEGKMLGTLIGAFIIAVIRNGMNLTEVDPFNQKIVLGAILLAAVLIDTAKRRGWLRLGRRGKTAAT
ncbi:MAG: ABC transporter permease [Phycisphaera sp.]|nr:ABC transporter permease [Phycisphaera sp.]